MQDRTTNSSDCETQSGDGGFSKILLLRVLTCIARTLTLSRSYRFFQTPPVSPRMPMSPRPPVQTYCLTAPNTTPRSSLDPVDSGDTIFQYSPRPSVSGSPASGTSSLASYTPPLPLSGTTTMTAPSRPNLPSPTNTPPSEPQPVKLSRWVSHVVGIPELDLRKSLHCPFVPGKEPGQLGMFSV